MCLQRKSIELARVSNPIKLFVSAKPDFFHFSLLSYTMIYGKSEKKEKQSLVGLTPGANSSKLFSSSLF